jgi:3-methyladenine DNA glycosylase AlkD
MSNVIETLRKELIGCADLKTINNGKHFFREEVKLYGVKTAVVGKIGKTHFDAHKDEMKSCPLI